MDFGWSNFQFWPWKPFICNFGQIRTIFVIKIVIYKLGLWLGSAPFTYVRPSQLFEALTMTSPRYLKPKLNPNPPHFLCSAVSTQERESESSSKRGRDRRSGLLWSISRSQERFWETIEVGMVTSLLPISFFLFLFFLLPRMPKMGLFCSILFHLTCFFICDASIWS